MRGRLLAWLALAVALVVGGVALYGQVAMRRLVEDAASSTLGVPVSVSSVRLGLFGADVGLGGIRVGNPVRFGQSQFLAIDSVDLDVRLPALLKSAVVLPDVRVRGVEVDLVRLGDRTNYGQIVDHLRRDPARDDRPAGEEHAVDFRIERLEIQDVDAHVRLLPEAEVVPDVAQATGLDDIHLHVPAIVLRDVSSAGSLREVVSHLSDVVVVAVVETIAQNATHLPEGMATDLTSLGGALGGASLETVGRITQDGGEALGETLTSALGEEAGDATRTLAHDAGAAFRALGGLVERESE